MGNDGPFLKNDVCEEERKEREERERGEREREKKRGREKRGREEKQTQYTAVTLRTMMGSIGL